MTRDEAFKLALEALHGFIPYLPLNDEAQCGRYDKAITAIKEALAQPEHGWTPERIAGMARLKEAQDKRQEFPKRFDTHPTPPQRTWVGLTEEDDLDWEEGDSLKDLVKAIESKLKELNT